MGNRGRTDLGATSHRKMQTQLYPAPAPALLGVRVGGTACRELGVFLRELVRELGDVAHNRKWPMFSLLAPSKLLLFFWALEQLGCKRGALGHQLGF